MRKMIVILFAGALLLLISNGAWAQDEETDSPEKLLYHNVEYTDKPDRQALPGGHGTPDPGQVLLTVVTDLPGPPNPKDSRYDYDFEIDAVANVGDAYFWEVINNTADLLLSFDGDPGDELTGGDDTCVWWESTTGQRRRMWIQDSLSCPTAPDTTDPLFTDLDGLETYGNNTGLANMASPIDEVLTDTFSVLQYGTPPTGYVSHNKIVLAVQALGYTGDTSWVNVDALMVSKYRHHIIFSITGAGNWHGGELVVMDVNNPGGAYFLNHGGHLWNTAWLPSVAFGVGTNEVDAIEAWNGDPPPETYPRGVPSLTNWGLLLLLVLLVISGIIVIRQRRRGMARA